MKQKKRAVSVLEKIKRAKAHVCQIAAGADKWRMSIPARPDNDSDLIIVDALESAERENARLREALKIAREWMAKDKILALEHMQDWAFVIDTKKIDAALKGSP